MTPDWKALAPHRPLDPRDGRYVAPPDGCAAAISSWITAGGSNTVLVGGPTGVGKSTELAQTATLLQSSTVACLVQLDRAANMRELAPGQAQGLITARVADLAVRVFGLDLSDPLRNALVSQGLAPQEFRRTDNADQLLLSSTELLNLTIREVARKSKQGRVCLLLDGLEKCPETVGRAVFEALARLEERVDLVVVIPWYAAFGPGAETVVRPGERLFSVRPPDVTPTAQGDAGRRFLREVLGHRLGAPPGTFEPSPSPVRVAGAWQGERLPPDVPVVVDVAATNSGGIPRTFLQILADAATYALLRRNSSWPSAVDIEDAMADQRDTLRRLLLPGDKDRIRASSESDGTELELEAKIRLMAHGILLERRGPTGVTLCAHPLVAPLLGEDRHA